MERKPVKSSNIKNVGYDSATKQMHVEFLSGGVYEYEGVGQDDYNSFVHDPNPGSHFAKHVRGKFTAKKLR